MIQKPSPNYGDRKGFKPFAVVVHIMDGTLAGTDSWFASTDSQVSSHYGIGKNGEIHQYVQESSAAWANGRVNNPTWKLIRSENPNLYTISIEHEGKSTDVWPEAQKQASAGLIREICTRFSIPMDREHIIGHYEIFSTKPNCPAVNKGIIDELIALAKPVTPTVTKPVAIEQKPAPKKKTLFQKFLHFLAPLKKEVTG